MPVVVSAHQLSLLHAHTDSKSLCAPEMIRSTVDVRSAGWGATGSASAKAPTAESASSRQLATHCSTRSRFAKSYSKGDLQGRLRPVPMPSTIPIQREVDTPKDRVAVPIC